jgi:hypothetical protein
MLQSVNCGNQKVVQILCHEERLIPRVRSRDITDVKEDGEHVPGDSVDGMSLLLCCGNEEKRLV